MHNFKKKTRLQPTYCSYRINVNYASCLTINYCNVADSKKDAYYIIVI